MSRPERDVVAEVLIAVTALPGAFFTRCNTGVGTSASGRIVRFGRPGQPDIRGVLAGRYIDIECKTERGRQSPEQRTWQVAVEAAGGVYILARSAADVLAVLTP